MEIPHRPRGTSWLCCVFPHALGSQRSQASASSLLQTSARREGAWPGGFATMPAPPDRAWCPCRGSAPCHSHGAWNSSVFHGARPKAACAHLVLPITAITAAAGPFQAGIKMPLKRSNGWGYLYFWFSVAPLLNLHPTKGREHPPRLGSVRNRTQKGRGRQQRRGHAATALLPHGAIWLAKRKMMSVYEAKAQTGPLLAQLPRPKAAGMPSVPV